MIPTNIQEKTLNDWQRQINSFVWNDKNPRIRFNMLQDEKKRGGLAASNIKLHYQAASFVWITDWIKNPTDRLMKLEASDLDDRLHSYLWIYKLN